MAQLNQIKIPIEALTPLLIEKLRVYIKLFNFMDEHDGWFPYSESLLNYFDELGVTHWADLYSREGVAKWIKEREPQHKEFIHEIAKAIGTDATIERVNEFLTELVVDAGNAVSKNPSIVMSELAFLDPDVDLSSTYVQNLSIEERQHQHDVWINQLVLFYNDLSIAAHGESIFNLVERAIKNQDDDALVKAVQIDRSLLLYFQQHLIKQSLKGNSDFLDLLAYRLNNPPLRGTNKHPLLWIFFKDLLTLGCLNKSITSEKILTCYQKAVGEHHKFAIIDDQIVQRQRRKFNKLYRQLK